MKSACVGVLSIIDINILNTFLQPGRPRRFLKKSAGTVAKRPRIFCLSLSRILGFDQWTSTWPKLTKRNHKKEEWDFEKAIRLVLYAQSTEQ